MEFIVCQVNYFIFHLNISQLFQAYIHKIPVGIVRNYRDESQYNYSVLYITMIDF
jgi:hypothetical protein